MRQEAVLIPNSARLEKQSPVRRIAKKSLIVKIREGKFLQYSLTLKKKGFLAVVKCP